MTINDKTKIEFYLFNGLVANTPGQFVGLLALTFGIVLLANIMAVLLQKVD